MMSDQSDDDPHEVRLAPLPRRSPSPAQLLEGCFEVLMGLPPEPMQTTQDFWDPCAPHLQLIFAGLGKPDQSCSTFQAVSSAAGADTGAKQLTSPPRPQNGAQH